MSIPYIYFNYYSTVRIADLARLALVECGQLDIDGAGKIALVEYSAGQPYITGVARLALVECSAGQLCIAGVVRLALWSAAPGSLTSQV